MQQQHHFLVRNQPWRIVDPANRRTGATLGDTIQALLNLASAEAGADGYGLYEFDQARSELTLTCGHGALATVSRGGERLGAVLFPLRGPVGLAGVLDFGFPKAAPKEEAKLAILRRCAESIEGILEFTQRADACVQLTTRMVEFETQIAELKIADRAHDILRRGPENGDATHALSAHVASVLAGRRLLENLQSQLDEYVELLDERRLVARAKYLLQETLACGEEQAYIHLRNASRRSRKPMREVARDFLERGAIPLQQLSA